MLKNTRFFKFFKSLKLRIIALLALCIVISVSLLGVGLLYSYKLRAISIRESEVLGQAKMLANQVVTIGYMDNLNNESAKKLQSQIDMLATIYDGRIMVVDQNLGIVLDTYNLDEHRTIISEEVIKTLTGKDVPANYDSENNYIEITIPLTDPDNVDSGILGVMLVTVSTNNIVLNHAYLSEIAFAIACVLIVVICAIGIVFTNIFLSPVQKLSSDIEGINKGYSDGNLEVNDCSETARICSNFNSIMSNMKQMDESIQEFVSNVSHELKTPLTSMKVLADSINSMGGEAPIELYQEFMGDITNEIERETKIINDLLSLVKMDKSAADLNIAQININELVEQILKRLQPIADKQNVALVLESFRPVSAEVDEVKLTLAITNLIENGIKYNRNDGEGWVHVSLNADHQFFYLKVEDSGMGIPEEDLEHIYERFYRVDKSHSREIGGTGLGLAITRSSILMHRGAIKVHSVLGEGTTFDVRIPLNYIV